MKVRARLGLLLIVAALVAVSLSSAFRQGWLTPHSNVSLVLSTNPGLATGVPVRIKGFAIGRVDRVELDDKGLVQVRLRIETKYLPLIPKDASVRLERDGFIGAVYLAFVGGSQGSARIADGDTTHFDPGIDWSAQASSLVPEVRAILGNLQQVTGEVAAERADLHEALANLAELTRSAKDKAGPILSSTDESAVHLRAVSADAQALAAKLKVQVPAVLEQADAALSSVRVSADQAQTSVRNLNALTAKARETMEQAQPDALRALRSGRQASEDAAVVLSGVRGSGVYRALANEPELPSPSLDPYEDRAVR